MKESERLTKSIKELDASITRLEAMIGNLSHPRAQAIYQYEKNKANIEEYANGNSVPKKDYLISGTMNERIIIMENTLNKLKEMVLKAAPKGLK